MPASDRQTERIRSMKFPKVISLAVLAFAFVAVAFVATVRGAGASGKWTATFNTQVGDQKYTWDFTAAGPKLTGKYTSTNGNGEIIDGKIEGDDLSWAENMKYQDMDLRIEYKAKLSGDEMKISRKVADVATEEGVAKRVN
jgi:hypothetical protein